MTKKYIVTKDFLKESGLYYAIPPTANLTKSNKDTNGVYRVYTWELGTPIAGLPAKWVSTLSTDYLTRTLVIYDSNKTTVLKTCTFTRTLDSDYSLVSETMN